MICMMFLFADIVSVFNFEAIYKHIKYTSKQMGLVTVTCENSERQNGFVII